MFLVYVMICEHLTEMARGAGRQSVWSLFVWVFLLFGWLVFLKI